MILLCVRWYCKYGISYGDLEEMMGERGVGVDHTTLYRWVQRYAPTGLAFRGGSNETYIRVKGRWTTTTMRCLAPCSVAHQRPS